MKLKENLKIGKKKTNKTQKWALGLFFKEQGYVNNQKDHYYERVAMVTNLAK